MKVEEQQGPGAHIFRVIVDCNDPEGGDHPAFVVSCTRGDMVVWETADDSPLNVEDIRKATQADVNQDKLAAKDFFTNPNADANPFPQGVPMRPANGVRWGPAKRITASQTYKYTLVACTPPRTFDPHIIVGR